MGGGRGARGFEVEYVVRVCLWALVVLRECLWALVVLRWTPLGSPAPARGWSVSVGVRARSNRLEPVLELERTWTTGPVGIRADRSSGEPLKSDPYARDPNPTRKRPVGSRAVSSKLPVILSTHRAHENPIKLTPETAESKKRSLHDQDRGTQSEFATPSRRQRTQYTDTQRENPRGAKPRPGGASGVPSRSAIRAEHICQHPPRTQREAGSARAAEFCKRSFAHTPVAANLDSGPGGRADAESINSRPGSHADAEEHPARDISRATSRRR